MELSWPMRLRVAAAMGIGALLVGFICWPCAAPEDPFGVVNAGNFDKAELVMVLIIAFMSGFLAYFVAWPYGREIAVLAVPTGLAVWALRDGSMGGLMQSNSTVDQRLAIFQMLRWEPFFWIAVVLVSFAGVYAASILSGKSSIGADLEKAKKSLANINILTAIAGSALIAAVVILQLARNERIYDENIGTLTAQPGIAQIAFAVIAGFIAAGFAVKRFLGLGFFWAILAGPVITAFFSITGANRVTIEHITSRWPAVFFVNSIVCILPIQIISFGTLGAIAGYWLAVKFNYWRDYPNE
jgi:hypothetical protein